ncbi:hypothetical protein [Streptomyces kronopolitis]
MVGWGQAADQHRRLELRGFAAWVVVMAVAPPAHRSGDSPGPAGSVAAP